MMHLSFENITIESMAASSEPKPSNVAKRKANTACPQDEGPVKRQNTQYDAPIITGPFASRILSNDTIVDAIASPCSSNTSRSSTPASTSSDRPKQVGRPKSKMPPAKLSTRCLKKSTVLRCSRPVNASLPQDVWINILIHSRPESLFKARAFASGFKDAMLLDSVWKGSLREEFGPLLPDPPQGLSYMQYANLLTRHGCQGCNETKHEGRGKARRTYWAFQRRYCEICLAEKIIYVIYIRRRSLP